MADEIINKLGFDASDAIAELQKLDQALSGLEGKMGGLGSAMQAWNQQTGRVVSAMIQIEKRATTAAQAVAMLQQALQGAAGMAVSVVPGAAPGVVPGAAPTLGAVPTPQVPPGTVSAINAANEATKDWTVSWKTLTRVVATQLIVRVISQIRDVMQDAIQTNIEFAQSLNLIKTIEPGQTLQQFSDVVRKLSDEMNRPIMDVSKGLYDVISQQVKGAEAQQQVLRSALEFAKVTGASAADAVQLLTSTMHAFGKTTDDIDVISSRFFRTIDIGNVTAKDFIVSFGRVAPVAKEMGASLEEAMAAYALLTQKGVRAEEAATQIAATFTAFIKPSADMEKAFRQIGVASGEEAIKAYGFMGAIQKVIQTTDGSADSLGKLFRNVRALRDVFAIARDGGAAFDDILKQIMETSRGEVRLKFGEMMQTDAEKVATAMNRIKNAITVDIGGALVGGLARFLDFTGVELAISAVKGLVVVVGSAVTLVVLFGGSMLMLALNAKLAAASYGLFNASLLTGTTYTTMAAASIQGLLVTLGQLAVLAAAAYIGGKMIGDAYMKALTEPQKKFREAYAKELQEFRANELRKADIAKETNDKIVQRAHAVVAELQRAYFRQVDVAKEANGELVADTKSIMERIIAVREKAANQFRQTALNANKQIQDSSKREYDLTTQLEDAKFKFRVQRYEDVEVSMRQYARRAEELASEAASALAGAATPEDAAKALEAFSRARSFAQEAASLAGQTDDPRNRYVAELAIEQVIRRQIDAEYQYQGVQAKVAANAAAAAAAEGERVKKLKELMKEVVENLNLFSKKGEPLGATERAQKLQTAQEALAKFWDLAFAGKEGKFDIGQLMQFETLQRRLQTEMEAGVSRAELKRLALAPQALEGLNKLISEGVGLVEIAVKLVPDKTKLPRDFEKLTLGEQLSEINQAIDIQNRLADTATRSAGENAATAVEIQRKQAELAGISAVAASNWSKAGQAVRNVFSVGEKARALGWREWDVQLRQESSTLALLNAQVDQFAMASTLSVQAWKQLAEETGRVREGGTTGTRELEWQALERRLAVLQEIAKLREKERQEQQRQVTQPTTEAATQGMEQLDQNTKRAKAAVDDLGQAAVTTDQQLAGVDVPAMDSSGLYSIDSALQQIAMSAYNTVSALYAVQAAAMSASMAEGAVMASRGGKMRHFATGGNVGTDVIPAMLAPGEFVINAASTRKFASQLVAMNAGVRPVFRSEGGGVTNIGDINVTVQGGGTGRQTARTIAAELRRELRRGTATL